MKAIVFIASAVGILVFQINAGIIENLGERQWTEIPNSHLYDVRPSGWSANVIRPWCGGAFDTKRDRLVVWGGGHSDYAGNEIYVFNLNTLKWKRLTDPAPNTTPNISTGEYPMWNGKIQPVSRHTYEYVEYIHSMDRFMSFGFASPYPMGGKGGNRCHSFNFETNLWERRMPTPGWGLNALSAYDPVTGHGWVKGVDSDSYLAEFMPEKGSYGTWIQRSNNPTDWMYEYSLTMDIDPKRRMLFATGGGDAYLWDISNPAAGVTRTQISTSGPTSAQGKNCPGLAYDPVTEEIIGWAGGRTVYGFNVSTKTWNSYSASGSDPGSVATHGTYGRFRYCPNKNVFVVVNSKQSNVFVYRHTAGQQAPQWYMDLLNVTTSIVKGKIAALGPGIEVRPNPFNSVTLLKIECRMSNAEYRSAELKIYNIKGSLVKNLSFDIRRSLFDIHHSVKWNASHFPAGIYILKTIINNKTYSRKLFLQK